MGQADESKKTFNPAANAFPSRAAPSSKPLRSIDAEERERALEALCAAYWKPVYKYVRLRWNRPADVAQDLTQRFFVNCWNVNCSKSLIQRKAV